MTTHERELPPLTDERVAAIEEALFAAIDRDRRSAPPVHARPAAPRATTSESPAPGASGQNPPTPLRRRHRLWGGLAIAAAVVIVAVVATPLVTQLVNPITVSTGAEQVPPSAERDGGGVAESAPEPGLSQSGTDTAPDSTVTREVAATASATLLVDDAANAAESIAAAAEEAGGYVESLSVSEEGTSSTLDQSGSEDTWYPGAGGSWITVRLPAAELAAFTTSLADFGEVTSSEISREDVTAPARDLRARVAALEASVERLTELLSDSGSVPDLLAAEAALAERQAELEATKQALEAIETRVSLSTLQVWLAEPAPVAQADPAGFGDGLAAGWSGLMSTLNGLVVTFGFLLPWLVIAAAVVIVVVLLLRRRRRPPASTS